MFTSKVCISTTLCSLIFIHRAVTSAADGSSRSLQSGKNFQAPHRKQPRQGVQNLIRQHIHTAASKDATRVVEVDSAGKITEMAYKPKEKLKFAGRGQLVDVTSVIRRSESDVAMQQVEIGRGTTGVLSQIKSVAHDLSAQVSERAKTTSTFSTVTIVCVVVLFLLWIALRLTIRYFYYQIGNLANAALCAKRRGDSAPVWKLHRDLLIDSRTSSPLYRKFVEILTNKDTVKRIESVFRALAGDADRLSKNALEEFCLGIYGETIWQDSGAVETWPGDSKEDHWWILDDFGTLFTAERPMNLMAFIDVAQLILHWRVALQFYQTRVNKYGNVCFQRLKPGESVPSFRLRAEVRLQGNDTPIQILNGNVRAFDMHTRNVGFYEPEFRAMPSREQSRAYHSPEPSGSEDSGGNDQETDSNDQETPKALKQPSAARRGTCFVHESNESKESKESK